MSPEPRMIITTENKKAIYTQLEMEFQALLNEVFHYEPDWLKEKRKESFEKFRLLGIPHRKNEEYKYTDVKKIFDGNFSAVHNEVHKLDVDFNKVSADKDSIKLIFVNGWLHKDSTLSHKIPKGAIIENMAGGVLTKQNLLKKYFGSLSENYNDTFLYLNSAFWFDGALIYLPANTVLERTVEIFLISTGEKELLTNPRHLIIAEKNTKMNVIEYSISFSVNKRVIVNSVAEILVYENAKVNYYKIQNKNENVFHRHNSQIIQKQNSHFETNTVTLNSNWARNDLNISIEGENCDTHLNGLFITSGSQFVDNHTRVYHGRPRCTSNQLYKGILDGKSVGVFNGKIFVERNAQKINAYQSSKNILLTDDATVNAKPELEIYADDVKCSHGSSTGKIDKDALFYLRSRGLSENNARKLLLHAFAADVLNTIRIDCLKSYLEELVETKLNRK